MIYIQAFDAFFLHMAINMRNPVLNPIMTFITNLGTLGAIWLVIGIAFLFYKKTREMGVVVILAIVLSGVINSLVLKNIFARPRPFTEVAWVNAIIAEPSDYSFPSGHTFASFAAAYVILKYNKKYGGAAYIVAILIAFSRVYLGVHYPTDIIAGAILGTVCGACSIKLYPKLLHYTKNKKHRINNLLI